MLIKKSVILTPEENKIIEIVEYVKYIRGPFPICKDIKSLIKKGDVIIIQKNDPQQK